MLTRLKSAASHFGWAAVAAVGVSEVARWNQREQAKKPSALTPPRLALLLAVGLPLLSPRSARARALVTIASAQAAFLYVQYAYNTNTTNPDANIAERLWARLRADLSFGS